MLNEKLYVSKEVSLLYSIMAHPVFLSNYGYYHVREHKGYTAFNYVELILSPVILCPQLLQFSAG